MGWKSQGLKLGLQNNSTPSFNSGLFKPSVFKHNLFNPTNMKIKSPGLKLQVEKSGEASSCNIINLIKKEEKVSFL
jgi:hypothetical protein